MQTDPWEINTTGLITGDAIREGFIFPIVEERRLKRTSASLLGCSGCGLCGVSVCGSNRIKTEA